MGVKALYSKVYLTLPTFRDRHQNHYFCLGIIMTQLLKAEEYSFWQDEIGTSFWNFRWSQRHSFSTCIFHLNTVWLGGLTTFTLLASGKQYFSRGNCNPFSGGGGKTSSVHKSPAHWMESCIFKLYCHSLGLVNSVCDNVGLFVTQAHMQHGFQILWNSTYFAFSCHTPPLNIQIMCLAESTAS